MIWVEITYEKVLEHMPTDVKARYDLWIDAHPEKEGRLATITANTIREFRDGIKSNPANYYHPDATYLPQSAVRHCESIIIYSIAMEMGLHMTTAGNSARTAADVFLRQIPFGRWNTTTEDAEAPSPRWIVPERSEYGRRTLPAVLAFFLMVTTACAGWIQPSREMFDWQVLSALNPTSYTNPTTTVQGHLQGIDTHFTFLAGMIGSGDYVDLASDQSIDGIKTFIGDATRLGRSVSSRSATASGLRAAAFGQSTATGSDSFACGDDGTLAAGAASVALGDYAEAHGNRSVAIGASIRVFQPYSFGLGRNVEVDHQGTFVWGDSTAGLKQSHAHHSFSVYANGGAFFHVPMFHVTGSVTAAGFNGLLDWSNVINQPPPGRFYDQGDGTVKDIATGLYWAQDAGHGPMTWHAATNYIAGLNSTNYLGYNDWRLPSVRKYDGVLYGRLGLGELDVIGRPGGVPFLTSWSMPGAPFVGVLSQNYWSAQTSHSSTSSAWIVVMHMGNVLSNWKTGTGYVWPVRGGPVFQQAGGRAARTDIDMNLYELTRAGTVSVTGSVTATTFVFPAGDFLSGDGTNLFYTTADGAITTQITSH